MACNSLCGADCPWTHGKFCLCPLNAVCASKVCVSTLCFICILNLEETLKNLPGFKPHVLFVVCKLTCVLFHCPVELQLSILLNGWGFFFFFFLIPLSMSVSAHSFAFCLICFQQMFWKFYCRWNYWIPCNGILWSVCLSWVVYFIKESIQEI